MVKNACTGEFNESRSPSATVVGAMFQPFRCRPGLRYCHISNAMHDTNTVEEQATYVMCDSCTFSYVGPLFLIALRIS